MNYESRAIALLNHKYGEGAVIAKVFTEKYGLKSFSIKRNKSKKSKNKILLLDKMSLLTINAKNNKRTQPENFNHFFNIDIHHFKNIIFLFLTIPEFVFNCTK